MPLGFTAAQRESVASWASGKSAGAGDGVAASSSSSSSSSSSASSSGSASSLKEQLAVLGMPDVEFENVADDPEQAETVAALHAQLIAGWRGALPPAA